MTRKETSFPFIVLSGTLESPGKLQLATEKHLICSFEGSLVEAALALLATYMYYVFMYNYPKDTGWQKAAIFHHYFCQLIARKQCFTRDKL